MTGRVVPIWTRQDAVDTAQQFHMEMHNAERGVSADRAPWWLTSGRESRARTYDATATTLFLILVALLGSFIALAVVR